MSWLSNLFSGGSKPQTVATPSWQTDPIYSDLQGFLQGYGKDMMQGNIPDWFKAIGEPAPQVTGNYITEAMKPYLEASQEDRAARGVGRSPMDANTMAGLGNMSATLQFQDYLRAMQGREDLLGLGTGITQNTRDTANQNQVNQNLFNQWKWSGDTSNARYEDQNRQARQANQTSVFGTLGSLAGGALTGIAGMPGLSAGAGMTGAGSSVGLGTGMSGFGQFLNTMGSGLSGIGAGLSGMQMANTMPGVKSENMGNVDTNKMLEIFKKFLESKDKTV